MRIGSLFSGIGGLELGLELAGLGSVIWQAESDPFCRKVLAKHWPDATRFEDVREVTKDTACAVDILCGGFPCTDISLAGKGAGLEGKDSSLWWEFDRIIRELRPRYVVVENVSALRSRGLGGVLGSLSESGYDAQWDCIPAQAVGAPHRRDRLYLVAWRVSDSECSAVRDQPERGPGASQESHGGNTESLHLGQQLADSNSRGCEEQRLAGPERRRREQGARGHLPHGRNGQGWPPRPDDMQAWGSVQADAQPAICRMAHGVPDRTHRLRALGNSVVPQVAELVGGWIKEMEELDGQMQILRR